MCLCGIPTKLNFQQSTFTKKYYMIDCSQESVQRSILLLLGKQNFTIYAKAEPINVDIVNENVV